MASRNQVADEAVTADWKLSVGQVALDPVQFSATSHWPAEARHDVVLALKVQFALQHAVPETAVSHCSPPKFVSTVPSPQVE